MSPTTDRAYAILPVKNTVLFPGLFLPLSVGRPASRAARTGPSCIAATRSTRATTRSSVL